MSAAKRRLPRPPYNPGVRELVEGKRAWDARASLANLKQGFRGWHERGYLPHRDSPGAIWPEGMVPDAQSRPCVGQGDDGADGCVCQKLEGLDGASVQPSAWAKR